MAYLSVSSVIFDNSVRSIFCKISFAILAVLFVIVALRVWWLGIRSRQYKRPTIYGRGNRTPYTSISLNCKTHFPSKVMLDFTEVNDNHLAWPQYKASYWRWHNSMEYFTLPKQIKFNYEYVPESYHKLKTKLTTTNKERTSTSLTRPFYFS